MTETGVNRFGISISDVRSECIMRLLHNLPWVLSGGLLALHGFAHTPAVLGSWGLATFEDVSFQPNVLFTDAGDGFVRVLGAIWLMAAVSFLVAGIGIIRQADWWPLATGVAVVLSVPMTILWREDAFVGLILNAVILGMMGVWFLIDLRTERQAA
jgi:hypothetical protein